MFTFTHTLSLFLTNQDDDCYNAKAISTPFHQPPTIAWYQQWAASAPLLVWSESGQWWALQGSDWGVQYSAAACPWPRYGISTSESSQSCNLFICIKLYMVIILPRSTSGQRLCKPTIVDICVCVFVSVCLLSVQDRGSDLSEFHTCTSSRHQTAYHAFFSLARALYFT